MEKGINTLVEYPGGRAVWERRSTEPDRSLNWPDWFAINKTLVENYQFENCVEIKPDGSFFEINGEIRFKKYLQRSCCKCTALFSAHYENDILCGSCFVKFHRELLYYGQLKQKQWLVDTYGKQWYKPRLINPQLELNL